MASKEFNLSFGALSEPLKKQLAEQGLRMKSKYLQHFQKDADALSRLHIRGLIPDSEVRKIRQKLMKSITKKLLEGV